MSQAETHIGDIHFVFNISIAYRRHDFVNTKWANELQRGRSQLAPGEKHPRLGAATGLLRWWLYLRPQRSSLTLIGRFRENSGH
jgi:hypothetical protein